MQNKSYMTTTQTGIKPKKFSFIVNGPNKQRSNGIYYYFYTEELRDGEWQRPTYAYNQTNNTIWCNKYEKYLEVVRAITLDDAKQIIYEDYKSRT
jgi:hypothetical protein